MKRVSYLAVVAILAWMVPTALRAEEGRDAAHRDGQHKEGERRDGEHKEGERKEGERKDECRELLGSFVKSADGMPNFKSGEVLYGIVLGQAADESTKEKLANFEKLLVNKGTWGLKGLWRKDSAGRDWLSVEWIGKRDGDGDGRRKDGERKDGDRKDGGERRKDGDHKRDGDRK